MDDLKPETELTVDQPKTPGNLWDLYRDWILIAMILIGWGITWGQLTTRLANDETKIAAQENYLQQNVVTREQSTSANAELQSRLSIMQTTLNTIQAEIFQMQEKDSNR